MIPFEIHITGDENILKELEKLNLKGIIVDLFDNKKKYMKSEYMSSIRVKFATVEEVKTFVADLVSKLNCKIYRVKIETVPFKEFEKESIYLESHFVSDKFEYPTSKNRRKEFYLATDRTFDKNKYEEFKEHYKNVELELCIMDTNFKMDSDWFNLYK